MIAQEIRDELDQTPAWWLRLFHQALLDVGAERVILDEIVIQSFVGEAIRYEYVGFPDCSCATCKAALEGHDYWSLKSRL